MRIALIETALYWENIRHNLDHFHFLFDAVSPDCKMIFLPEMFSTGFTMHPEKLEEQELKKVPGWLKNMSVKYGMALGGSSVTSAGNGFFNRFYFATPDGGIDFYDKRHLFRMGEEQYHYLPGNERKIFNYADWRILPQVCYDLRFPVWSRNRNDYDLLVYVANWPAVRQDAWAALLKARAIENQCYVAGVNRSGEDPRVSYSGGSVVFSPKGEIVSYPSKENESVIYADIDLAKLRKFREKFPAWMDADDFEINKEQP